MMGDKSESQQPSKLRKFATKAFFWFRVFVTVGVLGYLLVVFVFDWSSVRQALIRLRWEYVWLGPASVLVGFIFAAWRWKYLLSYFNVVIRWIDAYKFYLIGSFYGSFLPGVVGGDAVRVGMCALRHRVPIIEVATSVIIERVLGLFAVLIIGSAAVLFLPPHIAKNFGDSVGFVLPLLAIILSVLLVVTLILLRVSPTGWIKRLSLRFDRMTQVAHYLRNLSFINLIIATAAGGLFQFASIVASYFLARALQIDLPFSVFLAVMPLVYVITVLPISLGGLGVREGTLSYLLTRVGIALPDAILLAFVIYLNQLFVGSIGGVIQFQSKKPLNLLNRNE
jgi:uncharacterized protein (TIRG00374 family)